MIILTAHPSSWLKNKKWTTGGIGEGAEPPEPRSQPEGTKFGSGRQLAGLFLTTMNTHTHPSLGSSPPRYLPTRNFGSTRPHKAVNVRACLQWILFLFAPNWKQTTCPSAGGKISKLVPAHCGTPVSDGTEQSADTR